MTLSEKNRKILEKSSRSKIVESISELRESWQNGKWFEENNRYCPDVARLWREDSNELANANHSDLRSYIAASVLIHCFDGWSFLARALEAELSGDPDAARHLGYYAELRAAMSILAGEGIGVFNQQHAVVLDDGWCQSIRGPSTHRFTWEALEHWASLETSYDRFSKAIRPAGIPLQQWIDAFGGAAGYQTGDWLKRWGLDLSKLSEDRDARNQASYRPTAFTSPGPRTVEMAVKSVAMLWQLCSPGSRGEFSTLDRHLLREILSELFKAKRDLSCKQASSIYNRDVSKMMGELGLTELAQRQISSVLLYKIEHETPELIIAAAKSDNPTHIDHSKQVIARSTLLLRIATGSLSTLLEGGNAEFRTDLSFWWSHPSVNRRLWSQNSYPDKFADLWEEIQEALDTTLEWTQSSTELECRKSFWEMHAPIAALLTTPERIFLWGLAA